MFYLLLVQAVPLVLGIACDSEHTNFQGKCVNSTCMSTYLPRIKNSAGNAILKLYGAYQFVSNDLQVSISFDDVKNDKTMQLDNQYSCITHQLYRYESSWQNQQKDSSIISSSYSNGQTKWSWIVPQSSFATFFTADKTQKGKIVYTAFYALEFLVEGLSQSLNKYSFNFTLDAQTQANLTNVNYGQTQEVVSVGCTDEISCTAKIATTLKMCTDQTCGKTTTDGQLYFNEEFYLIQEITTTGFQNFYLNLDQILISGEGLYRVTKALNTIQRQGKLIIKLAVEFVYYNVTITVSSIAIDNLSGNRRMLSTAGQAEAIKKLDFPGCILSSRNATTCTCSQIQASGVEVPPESCKHGYFILVNIVFFILFY